MAFKQLHDIDETFYYVIEIYKWLGVNVEIEVLHNVLQYVCSYFLHFTEKWSILYTIKSITSM
jgi:hypothetical protein